MNARTSILGASALILSVSLVASGCATHNAPKRSNATPTTAAAEKPLYPAAAMIEGPIEEGHLIEPESPVSYSLAHYGYVEQEFFASGIASAFRATSSPNNGRWKVTGVSRASYRTRFVVRRPSSPERFNGTVLVEWLNVSGGESDPDWAYLNPELMADGFAYVGVSAQALGLNGGSSILGIGGGSGLIKSEPARYGSLHHPGDEYALDMFAQIGRALQNPEDPSVFGELHPKRILAIGESQSAFYLTTFADAIQPVTDAYDGFFIHSRGGGGGGLVGSKSVTSAISGALHIRTDLNAPVFMFETQTDLVFLGYAAAQQPNTSRIHTWEVAGTSHADAYLVGSYASKLGCKDMVNQGPQHYVAEAALVAFNAWVARGTAPPSPAPMKLASTNPVSLALDAHGNAIGGVRTPAVDVPVSTLSGAAPPGSSVVCSLFGSTSPFSESELVGLYHDKTAYLSAFTASLDKAIDGGYILAADRDALLEQAQQVRFPGSS